MQFDLFDAFGTMFLVFSFIGGAGTFLSIINLFDVRLSFLHTVMKALNRGFRV